MGIPVKLIFSLIWAISAGVAAVAGILLAPVSLIDINMGFIGLKAFAAAVLGGFGSIPGAVTGGIIIGLIELYAGATQIGRASCREEWVSKCRARWSQNHD